MYPSKYSASRFINDVIDGIALNLWHVVMYEEACPLHYSINDVELDFGDFFRADVDRGNISDIARYVYGRIVDKEQEIIGAAQ